MQEGYYYPWRSTVADGNGEQAYDVLVREHLSRDKDVLDVGCGHGAFTLTLAPLCRRIFAYDRVLPYLKSAEQARREADIGNVVFVWADASANPSGVVTIPARDDSFDLLISRRGPLHYLEDARRVARRGATITQLNPMESAAPAWAAALPPELPLAESGVAVSGGSIRESVERRLSAAGLRLADCWTFDVPEYLPNPEQLYVMLTWGRAPEEMPPLSEVREALARVFSNYAGPEGLEWRQCRFLWTAVVE
jgi:23S rRNA (guanine745-N1)-methyltransferase